MGLMALALMLAPGLLPSLPSPAAASWRYDYQVEPNSPEAHFLNAVRNAKDQSWV
jgi:coproporphyrinogen III oxidase